MFEEVYGHERARWFATDGVEQRDYYSFKRNEVHDVVAKEVATVRERVGVMDISAFSKIRVSGSGAESQLERLVANRLPSKVGGIALTHFLNERGRIELECTVVRLTEDSYYLVCAAFFEQRLLDHLHRYITADDGLVIDNLSSAWGALAINGPQSRAVLAACTNASLTNTDFRWLSAQQIDVAGKPCWALRLSYAGELGWELHTEKEHMATVYEALWAAGQSHGIGNYGSFAMNSMRLEKMFKGAGELTNEVTLPEADVMRFVKLDKDYVGKEATVKSLNEPLPWVCAYLSIDEDGIHDGHGGEAVLKSGQVVGSTASVAYGHSVRQLLAFAYLKPEAATTDSELEVVIAGVPRRARVLVEPAYDATNTLPRSNED